MAHQEGHDHDIMLQSLQEPEKKQPTWDLPNMLFAGVLGTSTPAEPFLTGERCFVSSPDQSDRWLKPGELNQSLSWLTSFTCPVLSANCQSL